MFRILESQAPAKQTATDTINVLSNRLQSATLLEDRRAAILGLRSFAKTYPASVASGALRDLISSIRRDAEDVDTIKVVLETLLTLFSPDENSPEASDEIVLWLADEFTQRQDNITALLDLLDSNDFYSRLYALQLMSQIFAARPDRTQECVFTAPLGISRLVSVLDDAREPVRNEALVLLIALTYSSGELQKLVAFENAFERTFSLIKAEGSISQGSEVVEDCLSLLANLLRLNVSNQSYFRETGCVKNLTALLLDATRAPEEEAELPVWTVARIEKNLWGLLSIIQLFLARGSISTPVNQTTFWQNGIMEQVLRIAFSRNFSAKVTSKALETCADLIRGNSTLQEKFADVEVTWYNAPSHDKAPNGHPEYIRINVIEALLKLALEPAPISALDTRLAASECLKAFFANHPGIRLHVLRRAIDGHISGNDQIPNILSVVLESPEGRGVVDPYRKWIAAVLMFHLLFEDPEAKALAMKVTEGNAEEGEEVITCVQSVAGNLVTGMQRGDDERISVAYIMLLSGWLFEDPDVVNDFLSEGSTLQTLIQGIKHSPTGSVLLPGLCSALLGIIYEFSTKDSPIPRETLHEILMSKLGREQYIDKITRLREDPLVRDFEVLPQIARSDHDGGLPEVFFDRTFVDFLKDNFSRLIRAIDRDPGIEVPVITNGIQKGISRELVDSLRAQVDERNQTIQKLEADLLGFQQKLDQEQLDHRRTKDSSNLELTRIKQINEALQKNHETELAQMEEKLRQQRTQLLKQHDEQLRAIDTQLKDTITDYESKGAKLRERYEREVADLRKTVEELRASLDRANREHSSELQTAREEASARYANLEARTKKMEQDLEKEKSRVAQLEQELKETRDALNQAKAEVESKERARKQTQDELDDLLIVFSDLEAKRKEDKKRLKELGQEVSEPEDEEDEDEDEEEAE